MIKITFFQRKNHPNKGELTVEDLRGLQRLYKEKGVESVFHGDLGGEGGVFLAGRKNVPPEERVFREERQRGCRR